MKKIKVLNLYAGIGGNRKLWEDVEVTAVEKDEKIAAIYQDLFPADKVIIGDAKEYLLKHFQEFDFIWASPPCPSHSRIRTLWKGEGKLNNKTSGQSFKLPDMDLYSIIIFLQHFFKGKFVVENVISYYEPLIKPQIIDNHYFWTNFDIITIDKKSRDITSQDIKTKANQRGYDLSSYNLPQRFERTLINNCVIPKVGLHIFNCAYGKESRPLSKWIEKR